MSRSIDIESIAIPDLDDEFARRVSRNRGDVELDMAGLRASTKDELSRSALSQAKSEYCNRVLEDDRCRRRDRLSRHDAGPAY